MSEKSEEKPQVQIKMKIGNIEFEITCREDQVKDVVDRVLSSVSSFMASQPVSASTAPIQSRKSETCRGIIEHLWMEGWFSEHRSLEDVHREMMRLGYHYDRTAVAHVLLDLVRDGILTREGMPRRYVYVQKRPPQNTNQTKIGV